MAEYWDRYWKYRSNRRRFLGAAGIAGAGLSGMALVGCGDDDEGSASPTSSGTTGGSPTAAASAPKVGGTLRHPIFGVSSGDPPTLYPFENISYQVQTISAFHYSRLLKGSSGPDINVTDYTKIEGDLAQNMPEQPDDVTYIFKFKPNIFFHDKAPMNGRQATAKDFLATWDFFKGSAINAARFNNVITSLEAPDDETIKITLKEPTAPFLVNGAASDQGIWFIPVETINNDQVKSDPVGTGPWSFDKYETGVRMTWKRHPKYYDQGRPYFENIDASLVRDPQRIFAALQAGELDVSYAMLASQITDVREKLPEDGQVVRFGTGSVQGFWFNFDNKPWDDVRVRKALSMSLDRQGVLDALDPTENTEWNSFFGTALKPHYLNPAVPSEFGAGAENFQYNVAEARKLLEAAGHVGLEVNIVSNVDRYGPNAQQQWEAVKALMDQAGFKAQNVYQEYGAYIQSSYFGKFNDQKAVGLGPLIGTVLDPDDIFLTCYWSGSARHNWQGTPPPEVAGLDAMFLKQRTLLDVDERVEYVQDIQRKMAESMLWVPTVNAGGLAYVQPWVKDAHYKSSYATNVDTFAKAYFTDERIAKG
ncbi:MAG: ABC transporter substrate-binding protein [Tepidiformaceae bacterium]